MHANESPTDVAPSTSPVERLELSSDVRFRAVFEEGVLIRQRAGEVMVVNEVGARILTLLGKGMSLVEIHSTLGREFDTNRSQLESDVRAFVEELLAAGVLERAVDRPEDEATGINEGAEP